MKKIVVILSLILLTGCGSKISNQNTMKDLSHMSKEEVLLYAKDNNLKLTIKDIYSNDKKDSFVNQSIKVGTIIKENDELIVSYSLGRLEDIDYQKYNVNELGRVPIMMYHGIQDLNNDDTKYIGGNIDSDGYQRTREAFINDLEFYYNSSYRMIRLADYIDGKIDVEIGKSPIVLTFDDGLANNIKVLGLDSNGEIIIDPNSAVGILESFKKKYPDYNVTATFFINASLFNQDEYNEKILNWLIEHGYDIGNHTYSHVNFKSINTYETEQEVGSMYQILDKYIKDKYVNIVALPFGSPGSNTHANFSHILSGSYNDKSYKTDACLRVGWEADYSPFSKNFDKQFIKRIRAYDNNGVDFDIEYNFNILDNNRYISDGNVDNIVIKEEDLKYLDDNNLNIITYN